MFVYELFQDGKKSYFIIFEEATSLGKAFHSTFFQGIKKLPVEIKSIRSEEGAYSFKGQDMKDLLYTKRIDQWKVTQQISRVSILEKAWCWRHRDTKHTVATL